MGSLLKGLLLLFLLTVSFCYLQDHLDLQPSKIGSHHRQRVSYSESLDANIDDTKILNLDAKSFSQLVDRYMEIIVLFVKERNSEETKIYENFLEELLPWKANNSECVITEVVVKDLNQVKSKFRPEKLPSLVFFIEKKKVVYQGEINPSKFLTWIQHIKHKEITTIQSQGDFDEFVTGENSPKLIGFYDSSMTEEVKVLKSLVETGVLFELGIVKVAVCFENCSISYKDNTFTRPTLALFRNLSDINDITKLNKGLNNDTEIMEFCNKETIPTLTVLNEETARVLFLGFAPFHLILVLNPQANNEQILNEFNKSAEYNRKQETYKSRIVHSVYFVDQRLGSLNEILGINTEGNFPELIMLNVSDSGMARHVYNNNNNTISLSLSYSDIREFIQDFKQRSLQKFLLSEPIPHENEHNALEKLVGLNLKSKVSDSQENYAVLFCENMEWLECEYSLKIFKHIAEKVKAREVKEKTESDLKFGYINTEKNEFELNLKSKFPVIVLFKSGEKAKYYEFGALHTIENVIDWLSRMLTDFDLAMSKKEIENFEKEKLSSKQREIYDRAKQMDKEEKKLKVQEQKLKDTGRVYDFDL